MDNFVISIDPTVTGFWGWTVTLILLGGAIVFYLLYIVSRHRYRPFLPFSMISFLLAILVCFGSLAAYGIAESQTESNAVWRGLWYDQGFTTIDRGPNGTYFLGDEDGIAHYAVVQTSTTTYEFTRISD